MALESASIILNSCSCPTAEIYTEFFKVFSKRLNSVLKANKQIDISLSGSTGTFVLLTQKHIVSANVGDSRVMLFSSEGAKSGEPYIPLFETQDHTPSLKSESTRIKKSGGLLRPSYLNSRPIGPIRIWRKAGDLPGLMMSRSFGDSEGHKVGVISEPDVWVGERSSVSAIFAASDGVCEKVSAREIGTIIAKNMLNGGASHSEIVRLAVKRWDTVSTLFIIETILYG